MLDSDPVQKIGVCDSRDAERIIHVEIDFKMDMNAVSVLPCRADHAEHRIFRHSLSCARIYGCHVVAPHDQVGYVPGPVIDAPIVANHDCTAECGVEAYTQDLAVPHRVKVF